MPMDPVRDELSKDPWRFEFHQAMRVLLRNSDHGRALGGADRRFDLNREPVRIGANASLAFPASDIQSLQEALAPGDTPKMKVNFLGLTGPTGVLPLPYTEFLIEREVEGDNGPAEFLDVFNHRMALLFYFAWEKYRSPVASEREVEHDMFRQILLSLVGLGTDHLQNRQQLPDAFFVNYAALLAIQPRSASALRSILSDYFGVPVEVQQFAGTWFLLDEGSRTQFQDDESDSQRVGHGVVVSEQYWSQESMVRLRLGPLDLPTYRLFLPGGADGLHPPGRNFTLLQEICRFFSRDEMVFEAQLILDKNKVPAAALDGEEQVAVAEGGATGCQLGWTTWVKSAPFERNAEDVVIRL
jgi:type VI secretion system protein ImpH